MDESPASSISGSDNDTPEIVGAIFVELGRSSMEQKQALDRYRETEKWIWSECSTGGSAPKATRAGQRREARVLLVCDLCHDLYTNKDKHCYCCHATFDKSSSPRQFSEHTRDCEEKKRRGDPNWKLQGPVVSMPSRLQLLKVEIIKIESAIPAKALKKDWTDQQRKAWAASLKSASEPIQVLQALTSLESMLEREWLSSTYETTEEITSAGAGSFGSQGPVPFWVPPTTAAVALRIRLLDNAIAYSQEAKEEREKQEIEDEINQKNTKMSTFRFTPEGLPGDQDDEQPADVVETVPSTSGKGRSRVRSGGGGKTRGGKGSQSAPTGQGGGRSRKSTISTGGGSKSRVRSSSSSAKKGLKRKLQFQEGAGEAAAPSEVKKVWGGAAKGRSARSAGGRGGNSAKRPSRAQAGPRPRVRRGQTGSRRPGQKQRNTNDLMVPSGETRSKQAKAALDDVAAKAEVEEDDEIEEESNGGDSQAGYADEGDQYEDGDQYDAEENNDDVDAEEQNGSDEGERVDEEEEEVDEEQVEEEDEEGEEVDEEAEEELEDDDGDGEGQEEDDGYNKEEGPGEDVYGRDADDAEEEEEEEAGGDETEDEDTNQERHFYSDEE